MKEVLISRIDVSKGALEQKKDHIAEEAPLHILLNKTHYATILCTPSQLKELVIGHLISEGILKTVNEIREISLETNGKCQVKLKSDIDTEKRIPMSRPFARLIVSACGSPDSWPITKLMDRLDLPRAPKSIVQAKGAAARAGTILSKDKMKIIGSIAEIEENKCIGCGECRDTCTFDAIDMIETEIEFKAIRDSVDPSVSLTRYKSRVLPAVCKGCGSCVGVCPVGAISLKHFTNQQLIAMIETYLGEEGV